MKKITNPELGSQWKKTRNFSDKKLNLFSFNVATQANSEGRIS